MPTEPVPNLVADLVQTLDEGNYEDTAHIVARLQEETSPRSIVSEFERAIEQDEYEEAGRLLDSLTERYEFVEIDETTRVREATLVRESNVATTEDREATSNHIRTTSSTHLSRSSFLLHAAVYLTDPEEYDKDELLDSTRSLKQREAELERSGDVVDSIADGYPFPPDVAILYTGVPHDESTSTEEPSLEVIVGNVGDETATGVRLEIDPDENLSVDSPVVEVGELEAGDTRTYEFAIDIESTEGRQAHVGLHAENAASDSAVVTISASRGDDQRESSGEQRFTPRMNEVPDWAIAVAGAAGIGIGTMAYLKYLTGRRRDEQGSHRDDSDTGEEDENGDDL